ncbi:MAG: ABC transporter permease subunit [Tannerellaceae bacterium]|jgi:ABC-type transport system involved in multi-copper enzyme maturation permease subunit|nr:ABC transporter permease subunit [Tannerellaceae bacterium]
MRFINDIETVARYESKLLVRSWFFRLFTLLIFFVFMVWDNVLTWTSEGGGWSMRAIPSNIPLFHLIVLNVGQAIIAIFLSSDFLKRDRKLDTSEVFYVRPLSNAAYVAGKIWGNLRVFFLLNLATMAVSILFTLLNGLPVDGTDYLIYFLLIPLPALVYITGLSALVMLALRNQALTFLLLLGYIWLTLFPLGETMGGLFDYMAIDLPTVRSTITGFAHVDVLLMQRSIYFFAGLGCISLVIPLFGRLPNTSRSRYVWTALAIVLWAFSGTAVYRFIDRAEEERLFRAAWKAHVSVSALRIDRCDIRFEQSPRSFAAEVQLQAVALAPDSIYCLCLNPGLSVEAVRSAGQAVAFTRDGQMIRIHLGRLVSEGDTLALSVAYGGRANEAFCYLDVPEAEMAEANRISPFNAGKQYLFQTPSYLLLTPESYWYPRSTISSFGRFTLQARLLPGLTAISQGEGTLGQDGTWHFAPEYPLKALSLIAGNYRRTSVATDSVTYNLWTIEGNPLASAFAPIVDTIPSLIRNFREDVERSFRLSYPFRRFSAVETPASFSSYPRAASPAQEMMQPEMLFFPERGWHPEDFDVDRNVKRKIERAQSNGQRLSETEALVSVFNDLLRILARREEDYDYRSSGRGTVDVVAKANPYFIYPQFYNFRYQVFSPSLPAADHLTGQYLQAPDDDLSSGDREREAGGISRQEKASLLMQQYSFRDLLSDAAHRDLISPLITLRASRLFAPAEAAAGEKAFRDTLHALLARNVFHNLRFEDLLDTLSLLSGADLRAGLHEWESPAALPLYRIHPPEVVRHIHRGQETFVMSLVLSNDSDNDGFVRVSIQDDRRATPDANPARSIALPARQGKCIVSLRDHAPRTVTIHTGLSGNLPNVVRYDISDIKQQRTAPTEREGDYPLPTLPAEAPSEVIVDNEDVALFELSAPSLSGLLPKWINRIEDSPFPYAGVTWRAPLQWTATTNAGYYGKYIRSAYVIRNGNGSQTATWKVPVPSPGHYDVYYYMSDVYRQNNPNRRAAEYHFRISYDGDTEDTYLNLSTADKGWTSIGAYYFSSDTIRIALTNDCDWRRISADAVRIVKR